MSYQHVDFGPSDGLPPPYNPSSTGIHHPDTQPLATATPHYQQPSQYQSRPVQVSSSSSSEQSHLLSPQVQQTHYNTTAYMVFSHCPYETHCWKCHQDIVSVAKKEAGLLTWSLCLGLTCLGCWCCACFPFCMDSTKDTKHYCPRCNAEVGLHPRILL